MLALSPGRLPRIGGLALLALVAIWLRANVNDTELAGVAFMRTDEVHYTREVVDFLNGHWEVDYFVNPTLYMYLLYAVSVLVGWLGVAFGYYDSFGEFVIDASLDAYPITIVGRVTSLVLGVVAVGLVFRLAKRMFSERCGWIAGVAFALNWTHIDRGGVLGNEMPMVVLLLLFFEAVLDFLERPTIGRHVLCGIWLGLAVSTKYNAGIALLVLCAASGILLWRDRANGPPLRERLPLLASGYLATPLAFVAGTPWLLVHFGQFVEDFRYQSSLLHEGYGERRLGWSWYPAEFGYLNSGEAFAVLVGIGLAFALWRAFARREESSGLLLAAAVPSYLVLGSGVFCQMRFLLPALPFLTILGARAGDQLLTLAARPFAKRATSEGEGALASGARPASAGRAILTGGVTLAVLAGLFAPFATGLVERVERHYRTRDPRAELREWMEERLSLDGRYLELNNSRAALFYPLRKDAARVEREPVTDGQRGRIAEARRTSYDARTLRKLALDSPDLERFETALRDGEADTLILSFWTPGGFDPRRYEPDLRRLLTNCKSMREFPYWREAAERILELERVDVKVSENRELLVALVRLP